MDVIGISILWIVIALYIARAFYIRSKLDTKKTKNHIDDHIVLVTGIAGTYTFADATGIYWYFLVALVILLMHLSAEDTGMRENTKDWGIS